MTLSMIFFSVNRFAKSLVTWLFLSGIVLYFSSLYAQKTEILSEGKLTYLSSVHMGKEEYAVDGVYEAQFESGNILMSEKEDNPWIEIDLGQEYIIKTVMISGCVDCPDTTCVRCDYEMAIRSDFDGPLTYEIEKDFGHYDRDPHQAGVVYSKKEARVGRFVTITLPEKNAHLMISEVAIWGYFPNEKILAKIEKRKAQLSDPEWVARREQRRKRSLQIAQGLVGVATQVGEQAVQNSMEKKLAVPRPPKLLNVDSLARECRKNVNHSWSFDWADVTEATNYEIMVHLGHQDGPLIHQAVVSSSNHTFTVNSLQANLQNGERIVWKVRSQVTGSWSNFQVGSRPMQACKLPPRTTPDAVSILPPAKDNLPGQQSQQGKSPPSASSGTPQAKDHANTASKATTIVIGGNTWTRTPIKDVRGDDARLPYGEAVAKCKSLGTGWRLPNYREWESMLREVAKSAPNGSLFKNMETGLFTGKFEGVGIPMGEYWKHPSQKNFDAQSLEESEETYGAVFDENRAISFELYEAGSDSYFKTEYFFHYEPDDDTKNKCFCINEKASAKTTQQSQQANNSQSTSATASKNQTNSTQQTQQKTNTASTGTSKQKVGENPSGTTIVIGENTWTRTPTKDARGADALLPYGEAVAKCKSLGTGWRLPNYREWESMLRKVAKSAPNGSLFKNMETGLFTGKFEGIGIPVGEYWKYPSQKNFDAQSLEESEETYGAVFDENRAISFELYEAGSDSYFKTEYFFHYEPDNDVMKKCFCIKEE